MADWRCAECVSVEIRGIDAPGHEEWSRRFIAAHMATHDEQLAEHGGDRATMRRRLRMPAVHAALTALRSVRTVDAGDS